MPVWEVAVSTEGVLLGVALGGVLSAAAFTAVARADRARRIPRRGGIRSRWFTGTP